MIVRLSALAILLAAPGQALVAPPFRSIPSPGIRHDRPAFFPAAGFPDREHAFDRFPAV